MESDARFYRRRANEELAAAGRAVTDAARERRMQLAEVFLQRLQASEARDVLAECGMSARALGKFGRSAFDWSGQRISQDA
jgi:hypothetical protein